SSLSFSRVRSVAGILCIGVLLRGGRSLNRTSLVSPDQARVHPNPFSSKLRTSPIGVLLRRGRSPNRTSLISPIRRGCTPTLFPASLGLHRQIDRKSPRSRAVNVW